MADQKIFELASGSISDNTLGLLGDPQTGLLTNTSFHAIRDYMIAGVSGSGGTVNTGSLATTSSLNAFTASYGIDSASFNNRINTNSGSFNTLSASYHTDSGSFLNLISSASGGGLSNVVFQAYTASTAFAISNSFASQSNYLPTSSYVIDSGSFNTRIANTSASLNSLSSSYHTDSGSFLNLISAITGSGGGVSSVIFQTYTASTSTIISSSFASQSNYLSTSSFNTFSGSYVVDSSSFNNRITNFTASGGTGISGSGIVNFLPLFGSINSLTGSNFIQSGSTNDLISAAGNKVILLSNTASNNPPMVEFRRVSAGVEIGRGSIGYLGSSEMNISNNMDYTNGSHKYYNPSQSAMWMFIGNVTNQFGMQWTKAGHPNDDTMWSVYGKVIWTVDVIPDFNGEAVTNGSRIHAQQLFLIDGAATGSAGTFVLTSGILTIGGAATTLQPPNLLRFIKQSGSSFNIGAGTIAMQFDVNGGVSDYGARGALSGNAPGTFTNMEYYWKTTNAAGAFGDRMVLNENGFLGIGNNNPTAYLHVQGSTAAAASVRIASGVAPTASNSGDMWFDGNNIYLRSGSVTETIITAVSASAPANTGSAVLWAAVTYSGSSYRIPFYQ